jgi:hypothetical protein
VVKLLKSNSVGEVDAVLDASFLKAWSTRHPMDSKRGFSDDDARVGRAGRTFGLGYKLHLSIDSKTMLPLTSVLASANQNEKKHSLSMLEKTKLILKQSMVRLRSVIADSQYSARVLAFFFSNAFSASYALWIVFSIVFSYQCYVSDVNFSVVINVS